MNDHVLDGQVAPAPPGSAPPMPLPAPPPPHRGKGWGVLAAVLLVVAGATSFLLDSASSDRSAGRPSDRALALAFRPGQEIRYHLMSRMRVHIRRADRLAPVRGQSSADLVWHVVSVDPAGTATVRVSRYYATARVDGRLRTLPTQQLTFRITPDGRVTGSDGTALFSGGVLAPTNGADELAAVLPPGDLKLGDRWTNHDSMEILGVPVSFTARSTYRRNVRIDSSTAAVISSNAVIPMDFVANANGRSMRFTGEMKIRSATWFDLTEKDIYRTRARARFTFGVLVTGDASGAPGGEVDVTGKMWTTLVRR